MKLPSNVIYSEWKHNDWYVYWDTTLGRTKDSQILSFYHITKQDGYVEYSVKYLWTAIKNGKFRKAFDPLKKLSDEEHDHLVKVSQDFLRDVEAHFHR